MGASLPPVIAIDGPSASGKGTVAQGVAGKLGFHYLNSGALYRTVALAALESGADLDNESKLSHITLNLKANFYGRTLLGRAVNDPQARRPEARRPAARPRDPANEFKH